jgi:hypothetical protein
LRATHNRSARHRDGVDQRLILGANLDDPRPTGATAYASDMGKAPLTDAAEYKEIGRVRGLCDLRGRHR